MHLLLIPVADALSAVQAHFARYPDESQTPTREETRELVELAYRFVVVSEALLQYAVIVGGRPRRN